MEYSFIEGKRICLRALRPEDLEKGYLRWINDTDVNAFLAAGTRPVSTSALRAYYENITRSANDVMFAIVVKKTDKYIGNIKLGGIDWTDRRAHCGRMIGDRASWGKGYGTEALELVLDYAFNTLNLNRVYNTIVSGNIGAMKSCEKAGMEREGVFPQFKFARGGYKDVVQYGITRDRYDRLRSKERKATGKKATCAV